MFLSVPVSSSTAAMGGRRWGAQWVLIYSLCAVVILKVGAGELGRPQCADGCMYTREPDAAAWPNPAGRRTSRAR